MKTFNLSILSIYIFLIFISNFSCININEKLKENVTEIEEHGHYTHDDENHGHVLAKYLEDRGITDEMTREQFIDVVEFFLTKTLPQGQDSHALRKHIPQHINHVPEKFSKDEIEKFISHDLLVSVMESHMISQHPPEYEEEIRNHIKDVRNYKNHDDL